MNELAIDLGGGLSYLAPLYSFSPGASAAEVEAAIVTWFQQTLSRDGYSNISVTAQVTASSGQLILTANGGLLPERVQSYTFAMQQFLSIGAQALAVVPKLHTDGAWDPKGTGKWHFFLPHGLPMLNFQTLQFFHYPPLRLMEAGDYLHDPVPYRWSQLLQTTGITPQAADQYQRYVDAVPIAAPDNQGAYMPVPYFADYQRAMTQMFLTLNPPEDATVTRPVLVFGIPAMAQFEHLFAANLDILVPQVAQLVQGRKTPCLGATHPYHFYAQAQIDHSMGYTIGDGKMGRGCQLAQMLMQQDLIAATWQVIMASTPIAGVGDALFMATAVALAEGSKPTVCALTAHQGSLLYPDPNSLAFQFNVSMAQAQQQCEGDANDPCCDLKNTPPTDLKINLPIAHAE